MPSFIAGGKVAVGSHPANAPAPNLSFEVVALPSGEVPENLATLVSVPTQATSEGATVHVPVSLAYDTGGQTATFSATGLPDGLTIDAATGVISGKPRYYAAQTNDGIYEVTVSAAVGEDTDSTTFHWTVGDTNRLAFVDDQFSLGWQGYGSNPSTVYSAWKYHTTAAYDAFGDPMTVSVSGLPGGKASLGSYSYGSPAPVIVSGQLSKSQQGSSYEVTLTLTGGGATDTRTFQWDHLSYGFGSVPIANNSVSTVDDFDLVGNTVPVSFYYLDQSGLGGKVDFTVSGPGTITGNTSVSVGSMGYVGTQVLLTDTTAPVIVTATLTNAAGSNVLGVAQANPIELKIATSQVLAPINWNDKVRGEWTPTGMTSDRIPPRVGTYGMVQLKGQLLANQKLVASVSNQGSWYNWFLSGSAGLGKDLALDGAANR